MGIIRAEQTRLLQTNGTEIIEFFVYDKDGNAKSPLNETKDVLKQIPSVLNPINQDLEVEYLPPVRDVIKKTRTGRLQLINKNPNFRYQNFNWDITASLGSVQIPSQILAGVNPISGIYCLYQPTIPLTDSNTTHLVKNILSDTPIVSGRDIEISWNYYIFTGTGAATAKQFISVGLDSTNDGSINKMYDFVDNKFTTGTFTQEQFFRKIDYTNLDQWSKYRTTLQANLTATETNPHIEVKLFQVTGTADTLFFAKAFFDGLSISQTISSPHKTHTRRSGNLFRNIGGVITLDESSNVTGEYVQKETFLSNEIDTKSVNFFPNEFSRKDRPLSFYSTNTLDKNVLQEIINDYREPLKRYEGTFYKNDSDVVPIYFYHKLWINFGTTVLQEAVSAIIDEMEYDVKQNQYRIVMHLPNQDDDQVAFDLYKFD
tara:strand:- start:792 stop:2081 length:1290 start_codon:yes stop_codon:yes gene_type:complete